MKLRECCNLFIDGDWIESKDQSKLGFRLIQTGNIGNGVFLEKENRAKYISEETFYGLRCKEVFEGDILLSRLPEPVGRACIIPEKNERMICAVDCTILRVKEQVIDKKYLLCFLRSPKYFRQINMKLAGTTRSRISRKNLEQIEIDIPSMCEQKRIVSQMTALDKIISRLKQQLQLLDTLVNARFVEMFGEYPSNDKKWETCTVGNVVSEVRYGSSRPAVEDGRYPYLRMNNITYSGYLDLNDVKRIDIPDNEVEKCSLRRGDVLFNRTNSKELVGKTCVYNRDEMMILAGFVIRIRMGDRMLPEFLSQFLNTDFSKRMLLNMCRAAIGQANINAQELKNIGIYLPPIDRQKEFVVFREKIDKSKLAVQKSLEEAQLLFDSLMQEYFG